MRTVAGSDPGISERRINRFPGELQSGQKLISVVAIPGMERE